MYRRNLRRRRLLRRDEQVRVGETGGAEGGGAIVRESRGSCDQVERIRPYWSRVSIVQRQNQSPVRRTPTATSSALYGWGLRCTILRWNGNGYLFWYATVRGYVWWWNSNIYRLVASHIVSDTSLSIDKIKCTVLEPDVARSVVSVSIDVCARRAHGVSCVKRLNRSRCRIGSNSCGSCIRWRSRKPLSRERAVLRGYVPDHDNYLRMMHCRRKGNKKPMRPFAKLFRHLLSPRKRQNMFLPVLVSVFVCLWPR